MEILDLFEVALMPILKVLLVTALGLVLAIDRIDLLGHSVTHSLNNLVFYVFNPALIGSNLAETITYQSLISLWFMPVNILLSFLIGSALAWILIKITRTPPHLQGLVIGCCSAGNMGNLLLIIVPAVCEESNSPFGDTSVCSNSRIHIISSGESSTNIFLESSRKPLLHSSDRRSPDDSQIQAETRSTKSRFPFLDKMRQRINKFTEKIDLKMIFAPSTIAAIIGFVIGTISPFRKVMVGESAPLRVLDSSAALVGEAAIPAMTLVIGANLLSGLKRSGVGVSLIMGIIAIRYILLPLLGIVIVKAAYRFGFIGSDSLYQFILLLQYAVPPALAVGTIIQLFETSESECSVILLWTYAVAAFALTLWITFYIWLLT
ncbi:protein PIN-LIKES 3 [Citrus sinensis]|uniref:Protein PIN-LIKES 3 n=1 Tax=Citrus sinensis TaxID=2711 RepID=A0ACB8LFD2_CITSI|nr:protein PIN-LIKES 3 [Citrus sinensis]